MNLIYRREPDPLDFEQFRGKRVIAIDGDQGAGKTDYIAAPCREALGGRVIDMDQYLDGSGGDRPHLEQLDLNKARQDIASSDSIPLIVVSVLLLDILEALGVEHDALIFAKLFDNGSWKYKHHVGPRAFVPKHRLTREIAEYYNRRKPWEKADRITTLFQSVER